jgi:hypothetical protein
MMEIACGNISILMHDAFERKNIYQAEIHESATPQDRIVPVVWGAGAGADTAFFPI